MNFWRLLKDKKVVLLDGAMGTQLDKKGLMGRGRANLDAPQAVLEVHRAHTQAGCDALVTNTLTMNRIRAGAQIVGGCCGTTPEQIRAVYERIRSLQPAPPGRHCQSELPFGRF